MEHSISYSVDIAKRIGVTSAVLISFLDSFIDAKDDKVLLSRDFIYAKTGIQIETQKSLEENLSKIGVISVRKARNVEDKNHYGVNYEEIDSLLNSSSVSIVPVQKAEDATKKRVSKETKKEQTLRKLKNCVDVSDDVIKQYIFDWIDSVVESGNYLTTQSVKINVSQLLSYSNEQQDLIDVLLLSTKNSWRDLGWAMERLKKKQKDLDGRNFADYGNIKYSKESLAEVVF